MGAKEAYFFNTPTHWAWHNLPPDVEALFTKTPPIKDVLDLALGNNGTYFVSYRDWDERVMCRHYNLPNPLTEYLYHSHPQVIRDLLTLSITIGPYDSYYAHDKTSASWSNLPAALEKAILGRLDNQDAWKTTWKENGREAPSFVSLGDDGSYFMRTVSGGGSWDLRCKSEGMVGTNKFLDESTDFQGIAGLFLFPSHTTSYILLLTSGKAFSNLPENTWPDYNKMAPAFPTCIQSPLPIPPMPQPNVLAPPIQAPSPVQQVQFQQQTQPQFQQQQRQSPGFYPQTPPFPPPYNNPQPRSFYSPNAMVVPSGGMYAMGVVGQPQQPQNPGTTQ
ncbi:hypothetical protein K504DRAFT_466173 [Pleomassaria siparia CBS 279.74]|uniref:Uncharacterized protein n=1 Tax=Pleomassaria siparia CBS 279.74 TaxID=1314801 RepID=A0A6G1KEA1_9PLEO|nr:hypothetical protein K504DRAFT_466173 [Pleomassaria siparia CBS 279.74]